MSPTFHISEQSKIFSQPDISADMESYWSHPNACTSSVFDLAEDGGRTDFNKILGDH
jgi:hypothetical protein